MMSSVVASNVELDRQLGITLAVAASRRHAAYQMVLGLSFYDCLCLGSSCKELRSAVVAAQVGVPASMDFLETAPLKSTFSPALREVLSRLLNLYLLQACPHNTVLVHRSLPSAGSKWSIACCDCRGAMVLSQKTIRVLLPLACNTACGSELAIQTQLRRVIPILPAPDQIGTAVDPGESERRTLGKAIVLDLQCGEAFSFSLRQQEEQQGPPVPQDVLSPKGRIPGVGCACCIPDNTAARTGRRKTRRGTRQSRLQICACDIEEDGNLWERQ